MISTTRSERLKEDYRLNKPVYQAKARAYYLANKAKIIARQKERKLADPMGWKIKVNALMRARRASQSGRLARQAEGRARYKKRPDLSRKAWLKNRYGMTVEQHDSMLRAQGGCCAICRKNNSHPTRWGTKSIRLTIDHCHKTGKVRALLCHTCNSGLGYFKDDPNLVKEALDYLRFHNAASLSS